MKTKKKNSTFCFDVKKILSVNIYIKIYLPLLYLFGFHCFKKIIQKFKYICKCFHNAFLSTGENFVVMTMYTSDHYLVAAMESKS